MFIFVGSLVGQAEGRVDVQFDRPQYLIKPGEIFPVAVRISLLPGQSIASFGVQLLFDPSRAVVAGVQVGGDLSFNGPRGDAPVVGVGEGFAAAKGTVRFAADSAHSTSNETLVTFLVRDLGNGPHELRLNFFNTLGPTEQVFVDSSGGVLDPEISFGTAQVLPVGGLTIAEQSEIILNRQTGLFEQKLLVKNEGFGPIVGATIHIRNLPPNWEVWNASGTNSGAPYLRVNSAIPGGGSLPVRVEFRIPGRNPEGGPEYSIIDYTPEPTRDPGGESFRISPRATLSDGSFLLEFSTLKDRLYAIQYSPDLEKWATVVPSLKGNGSRVQWIDNGPPKTESVPGAETNRFYRVIVFP